MKREEFIAFMNEEKARGRSEEDILIIFCYMFREHKISRVQFEAVVDALGYEITPEFKELTDEELRKKCLIERGSKPTIAWAGQVRKERTMRTDYKKMIRFEDYPGIIGAAIGDVWGSYYEFQHGPKTPKKDVRLHPTSSFTDDTVLTAAIADYLARKFKGEVVTPTEVVQRWAQTFPNAGYGGRFYHSWLFEDRPEPYNSFGNGSAMRISAVPYFARSLDECKSLSREVTEITHNHPEGIKGAEVIAVATYMALHGSSKSEIEAYAKQHYDLDLDYEEMMAYLGHGEEICQVTVPQALWCFLHSDSFEDCLRLAISIRWDADTLAAIACTIAEAYYKEIPESIYESTVERLDSRIRQALEAVPNQK